MKKLWLLFLCFTFPLLSVDLANSDMWNITYSEGIVLIGEGNYQEGIEKINICVNLKEGKKDFFYYDALLQKAYALNGLQKYKESISLCTLVIEQSNNTSLKHEALNLRMSANIQTQNVKDQVDDMMSAYEERKKIEPKSYGQKTVIGYIPEPSNFSLSKLKCFLIHNRMTYGKADVKLISPNHYLYNSFCHCGCPESESKIKNFCDECGVALDPIPSKEDKNSGWAEIEKMYEDLGWDIKEYEKVINERMTEDLGTLSKKKTGPIFLSCGVNYYQSTPQPSPEKTACTNACWGASVAGAGWCTRRFKDRPYCAALCASTITKLYGQCLDCCKSKDDFLACTGPFGKLALKVKCWYENYGVKWVCNECGTENFKHSPPFCCDKCYTLLDSAPVTNKYPWE